MSMQEGAKNIKELLNVIKPYLTDMRGDHENRIFEINIRYDKEDDDFIITTD